MRATETQSPLHVPTKAPSTVSDEIENELSRLAVRHPIRSQFLSALKFIIRPESMTAYATLAAAFAAFLSLKATDRQEQLSREIADRQERATFTSALYGKEVDATTAIVAKLENFARAFPSLSSGSKIDYQIHATDSDFQKAYGDYQEAFYAINTVIITYPKETEKFFNDTRSVLVASYMQIKKFQDLEKTSSISSNLDQLNKISIQLTRLYLDLFQIAIGIEKCATEQLRESKYIDGSKFSGCTTQIYNEVNFNSDEALQ